MLNNTIFFFIYSLAHQTSFLDSVIIFCAKYLQYFVVLGALIYLFQHYVGGFDYQRPFALLKTKVKEILLVFVPASLSWVMAEILKGVIQSPRPFLVFQNTVQPLFLHGGLDSFPSGHAIFFGALAMSLYFVHKKIGKIYFFIALIIGLARVAAGVHFPIDILFGYIFGILIAFLFHRIFIKKYS